MYDSLTGLLDRTTFFSQLNAMMRSAAEHQAPIGLLIIDVCRFSRINDNFGYVVGDRVLQGVAEVLKRVVRDGDLIARIADDQFVLALSRIANIGHAELAAIKIQKMLELPIEANARMIRCPTAIGIGLYPNNSRDAESLLLSATKALYKAKRLDQPIGIIDTELTDHINEDWDIEIALEDSIDKSELEVYFQPKISLIDNRPVGAEALIRWNHTARGLILPGVFLPAAESIGFLKPMSIWMLNSALRYSADWTDQWGELGVSVNIPPSMMAQPDFTDVIMSATNLWPTDNAYLCLEILEEALIDDVQLVFDRLEVLRNEGIKISVDDFGTGYSSLSYFRDIPADELKIDRSFIKNFLTDEVNRNIVSLIIEMAQLFGLTVVAEGVENKETMSYLKTRGCDYIQGFYIAKPMPALEFQEWLESYSPEV